MCAAFPPLDAIPTSREKLWSGRSRKRASPTGGMGRDWAAVASTKRDSPHATRPGETMRSGLTPTTWTLRSFGEGYWSWKTRRAVPVAVMCAETLWWRCHRRLIADALTIDGFETVHLIGPGASQEHKLHDGLRLDTNGHPVYDVGVATELFP